MRGNSGSGGWVGPHPSGWADLGRDLEGRWELAIDLKGGSVPCTFEEEQRGQRGWSRVGQGEGGAGGRGCCREAARGLEEGKRRLPAVGRGTWS